MRYTYWKSLVQFRKYRGAPGTSWPAASTRNVAKDGGS